MTLFELLPAILANLLFQSPLILLWMAGIYAAVRFRDRNPTISQRSLIAFILFIITAVLGAITSFLPVYLSSITDIPISRISVYMSVFYIAITIIRTIGWAIILHAIFSQFPPAAKSPTDLI